MKSIKTLLCGGLVCLLATTSCLSDQENYRAGFPVIGARHAYVYANNLVDSFRLVSYGPWRIDMKSNDGNWCRLAQLSGKGYTDYTFGVTFSENTTGHSRTAIFSVTDTEHTDISANFGFLQYATRGDGSMGNAAEVRSIKGSDGTAISLTYDRLHRPLTLDIQKNGEVLHSLAITYNDLDSTISVRKQGGNVLTARMSQDYQPAEALVANGDTVMYRTQIGSLEQMYSSVVAFNVEYRQARNAYMAQAIRCSRQSLAPDSIHNSDSLRYQHRYADGTVYTQFLKLIYSKADNRYQTVDVNQLLLGIEECNPYQLISLFKLGRNSNIISSATSDHDEITVTAELNSNKSVSRLSVKHRNDEQPVIYDFTY